MSFSSRIWFERSTFHWPCNGLMYDSLGATLTFEGSVARASWADTCFENQLLYLLEINVLAGLLTDTSKGWNLFVRLCGTMTTLHKFSPQSSFRYVIILALECIHYHQRILLFKDTFFLFNCFQVRKYDIHEKRHRLWSIGPVTFRERHWKWFWEAEFRQTSFRFPP